MARDDWKGEPVIGGTWLYDGKVPNRIFVVACNFDRYHAWLLDEAEHVLEDHNIEMEDLGEPRPMGPDGLLYHIGATTCPDFETIEEAKAWADGQPWGPVNWDA